VPYDLFFSYAHQGDNTSREAVTALVARLHAELEADFRRRFNRDLEIFFDKEDIQDFDHWQVRCHRALRDSRFFIACLSRTYLRSNACRWEWEEWCRHELEHGLVGQGAASLWFVKLEDLDAPEDAALLRRWKGDLLQRFHIQCYEWRHHDHGNFLHAAARSELQQLTEHVAQRLRLLTLDRARRGNLPWPNANFVGREPELASLRAALLDAPEQYPAGIHGVGGMGKTALAQAFAYKEGDAFPGGCWLLRCEGRDRLLTVFRTLVSDLEIELTDEEKLDDAKAVRRVFDVLRARGPALFLLDNVDRPALLAQEHMKLLAEQPWAHVLYTTRLAPDDFTKAGAKIRPLDLDRLPEDQAVDLIRRYQPGQAFASPKHEAAVREIVRELSGLTLAVETAAVYLGQCDPRVAVPHRAVEVQNYLGKLREDLRTGGGEGVMSQLREVTATLRPTLARLDAPALTVLQIASLLAPDGVALPWVRAIAGRSHPELATDAATGESDPWTQLIRGLIGMRLLQPTAEPRVVAIHRILQRVLESELHERRVELQQTLRALVRGSAMRLADRWTEKGDQWEVTPLAACGWHWMERSSPDGAFLGYQVALPLRYLGHPQEAERLLRKALDVDEKNHGPRSSEAASTRNQLSDLLRFMGRLEEAEQLARLASNVDLRDIVSKAIHKAGLAKVLIEKNQMREAEPLLRQSLGDLKATLGPSHPHVATCLNVMVILLTRTSRFAEAMPLARRSLEIYERSLGPAHPHVATALGEVAQISIRNRDYAAAEMALRRALAIDEEVYGDDNPAMATDLSNLAMVLELTGKHTEAEEKLRRALTISEKELGRTNPEVAVTLRNLAALLIKHGKVSEGLDLAKESLKIEQGIYGANHPRVAACMALIAQALEQMNRLNEAEDFLSGAMIMLAQATGATGAAHPAVEPTANALIALLRKMGTSEAVALERANEILSRAKANRALKSSIRPAVAQPGKKLRSGEFPVIMGEDDTLLLFSKTDDGMQLRARTDSDPEPVDLYWQIMVTQKCPHEMRKKAADWLKNSNDERALQNFLAGLSSRDSFTRRASAQGIVLMERGSAAQKQQAQQVIDQLGN
jgi:tetratricopeptide (TPR) repeat protein